MAVKSWDAHVELVEESGVMIAKSHKELTVLSWDELAAHDCSMYLQGSIAYNINEQKLAVWDGSDYWVDTDGESHAGGRPVELYWYVFTDSPQKVQNGDTINAVLGYPPVLMCFDEDPPTQDTPQLEITGTSSDTGIFEAVVFSRDGMNGINIEPRAEGLAVLSASAPAYGATLSINIEVTNEP